MKYNKVIFVCNYCANYGGNFLASLSLLAKKLKERGIKVYFIFPEEAKKQKWEIDLSKFKIIYSNFNNKRLVNTIKNCITKNDYAIIHLHFLSSLLLLKLKKITNNHTKFVFHQHMAVDFGLKQVIKGLILRLFGPKNAIFIGVSPEVFNDVKREIGCRKSRLVLNAVDTRRLDANKKSNNSNILIFGTDFMRKGVDLAVKAIIHSKIEKKCKLVIVTHNVKEAHYLILKNFNKVPSFVNIISPVQDVRRLYQNSFLFLSPSRLEAFGYAVVEAAYSGDEVIASNVPGQNTLSKIPGIKMFQSENIDQLRYKIVEAFNHKDDNRVKINKQARGYIIKQFSLESWANSILKIYSSL